MPANEALLTKDDNQHPAQFVSFGKPRIAVFVLTTTPQRIDSGERRISIKVKSVAVNTEKVYINFKEAMTAANSDEISVGAAEIYDVANGPDRTIWAMTAAGTANVRVVEI